jgi:hypothetical protein
VHEISKKNRAVGCEKFAGSPKLSFATLLMAWGRVFLRGGSKEGRKAGKKSPKDNVLLSLEIFLRLSGDFGRPGLRWSESTFNVSIL